MKSTFMKIRNAFSSAFAAEEEDYEVPHAQEDYVELNTGSHASGDEKIKVRPFVLHDFGSVKGILETLREGYTIALVNIKPLKDKDLVELKRAINKLKKTTDAISGDIAGFGDEWIIVAPSFVEVYRETRRAMEAAKRAARDVRMDDDADLFKE